MNIQYGFYLVGLVSEEDGRIWRKKQKRRSVPAASWVDLDRKELMEKPWWRITSTRSLQTVCSLDRGREDEEEEERGPGDDIKKGEASLMLFLYTNLAPVFLVCKTCIWCIHQCFSGSDPA